MRVPRILKSPEQEQFQIAINQLKISTKNIENFSNEQKKQDGILQELLVIIKSLIHNGSLKITTADSDRSVNTNRIQIGTTQPQIIVPRNSNRKALTIRNNGPNPAYIGGPEVSAVNGFDIAVNDIVPLDRNQADIWAISSGGNTTLSFLEE